MSRVVKMPEVMPDAVRLAEHACEEIPVLTAGDIQEQRPLSRDAAQQIREEVLSLVSTGAIAVT
jgi:hypothetical protein